MSTPAAIRPRYRRFLAIGLIVTAGCGLASAQSTYPGLATITSLQGSPKLQIAENRAKALSLHETASLNQSRLLTGESDQLICLLSNNIALGLSEDSVLEVASFQQNAIKANALSLTREPSTSQLKMRLHSGSMVLSAQQMSPLSRLIIELPVGQVQLLSSCSVLTVTDQVAELTVHQGAVTYRAPDGGQRQYLTAPVKVTIRSDRDTTQALRYADSPELDALQLDWVHAVQHAHSRVLFTNESLERSSPPQLAVSPDYYQQAPARPYTFRPELDASDDSSDL